jgi:hypothetical protein
VSGSVGKRTSAISFQFCDRLLKATPIGDGFFQGSKLLGAECEGDGWLQIETGTLQGPPLPLPIDFGEAAALRLVLLTSDSHG